ncbi:hypothetical protein [Mycobacterium sp. Aquia_213]|uniref:hypothetical protein n=1 Tax=Mycobacterium sp. Aquia_213 TaxID=2991728 RepID=UPI00226DD264|nr:hypothetical protein [Mycobacterium sp. Aquia_213]WAC90214.1 hypothetical protein LMQ14_20105 [Mycobacterium sp. Aquia_213]
MSGLAAQEPCATFRYDLPSEDIAALTEKLIATKLSATDDGVVCYRVSGRSPYSDIGRAVECQVFRDAFPGNDAAFMTREYGPYEGASFFFLSVDREKKTPVGALRIIRYSPAGLKTLNDLARPDSPVQLTAAAIQCGHQIDTFESVWDIGTFAILSDYRRSGASVSLQLYRGMYATALEEGIDHLIAIFDKLPLLAATEYLAIPIAPLCGTDYFSYLGSAESRAIYGHIPSFEPAVSRRLIGAKDDPDAVRALRRLRDGTDDHLLLFDNDYKN